MSSGLESPRSFVVVQDSLQQQTAAADVIADSGSVVLGNCGETGPPQPLSARPGGGCAATGNPQRQPQQHQGRRCARCAAAFGRFYNTGAACPRCRARVCRQCRESSVVARRSRGGGALLAADWVCSLCHGIQDLRSVSAEWRRTTGKDNYLSALDILKHSIRRAWTINGPPARWSTARKSPEFRPYRSLPSRRSGADGDGEHLAEVEEDEEDEEERENRKNARKRQQQPTSDSPTGPAPTTPNKPSVRVALGTGVRAAPAPVAVHRAKQQQQQQQHQNEARRSNIPVFRSRSSREFEDIRGPNESPKRSLIPQRFRGSTDDLRRSREDISSPISLIPKPLTPRGKEDKLKRQDSRDDVRAPSAPPTPPSPKPRAAARTILFRREARKEADVVVVVVGGGGGGAATAPWLSETTSRECLSENHEPIDRIEEVPPKMVEESSIIATNRLATRGECNEITKKNENCDETDEALPISRPRSLCASEKSKVCDKSLECSQVAIETNDTNNKEIDKQRPSDSAQGKKIDEPLVVKRKFSKEEHSNDDTDDTANRRCSSHLSPEASPLSTRSSKYSPRESESEPTPALPRKTAGERGESSSASQRIRDAITRTRRESNSSHKYESSGSEGVRLGESVISNYVDIARRVKLFGSGSIAPSTGSCDEVLQRDSATSAGEDEHDDHSRDLSRMGPSSQSRVMLRRRRQFDTQGPRRRGRPHARACFGAEELQALQVIGCSEKEAAASVPGGPGTAALLDYRRLVFISSDSSSGREEDDADSSCSSSSYLNRQQQQQQQQQACCGGLEDCDWDYFESNSLKLPQLQGQQGQGAVKDWSCCLAKPSVSSSIVSGCCQACGGLRNAKVLPVPVPIPVPVPYPVPVPASLWTGEFAAGNPMIGRDAARLEQSLSLSLRGCDPSSATTSWFSWNPRFDPSSLLFTQGNIFSGELPGTADVLPQPDQVKQEDKEEKIEPESKELVKVDCEIESQDLPEIPKASTVAAPIPLAEENEQQEQPHQRMFRHSQEQDSRSSSGRSSADSSDLEDSESHHFSRVLVVNDDSLTSDNDIEDNEDSDSAREGYPASLSQVAFIPDEEQTPREQEPVVLRKIRHLDEDSNLGEDNEDNFDKSPQPEYDEQPAQAKKAQSCREIASYDEIYFESNQDNSDDLVLLKSVRSIDPETVGQSVYNAPRSSFAPGYKPEELDQTGLNNSCASERDDSSNDSVVMPDSLEVSMQELEDSIEATDIGGAPLAASSPVEGETGSREGQEECSPSRSSSESGGALSCIDEVRELASTRPPPQPEQQQQQQLESDSSAALMAKSRKKWQIPASFDIKGIPSCHFMPPERSKSSTHSSLLSAIDANEELQPEDDDNANGYPPVQDDEEEEEEDEHESSGLGVLDESVCVGSGGGGVSSVRGAREQVGGSATSRALEQRTPTRKEDFLDEDDEILSPRKGSQRDWYAGRDNLNLGHLNNNNNGSGINGNQANNKYKSLVMITQGAYQPVNVITSDTTMLMQPQLDQAGDFQPTHEANPEPTRRNFVQSLNKKPLPCKRLLNNSDLEVDSGLSVGSASESDDVQSVKNAPKAAARSPSLLSSREEDLAKLSGPLDYNIYSAQKSGGPLILEEGLADDDSWVEEISHDEDEQSANTTATEESSEDEAANNLGDREEELRGYHRQAIDFTLHTIVEESCEESESEHISFNWRRRITSASTPNLDNYFVFGHGNDNAGAGSSRELDSLSETSSIFSEGQDSLACDENSQKSNQEKISAEFINSSSRSEKYCLNEFLGLEQDRRDSDGSVGSDSEGRPSPEAQRRKRLVRARGTGRSHSSSLDNLLALAHSSQNSLQDVSPGTDGQESQSEGSSTETDGAEDNPVPVFGVDGQFDTVKRKKKKLRNPGAQSPRVSEDRNKTPEPNTDILVEEDAEAAGNSEEDGAKTPQPENLLTSSHAEGVQIPQEESTDARCKQQSRDSGFVGSCDDLLLQPPRSVVVERHSSAENPLAAGNPTLSKNHQQREQERNERPNIHERILESQRLRERLSKMDGTTSGSLSRKDSFNNWSSDEETNLMMSKMRQFFKTMVVSSNAPNPAGSTASSAASPVPSPSPRLSKASQNRTKPPQLVYFENELTRLMKLVPGIRDEQVREIVEYLSSEDTWSDSYDSSDYTSSDLEGAAAGGRRSALQEQISQSCQQIISKFDSNASAASEKRAIAAERQGAASKPGAQTACLGRDTAFVYQKLVQSFTKMAGENVASDANSTPHSSPPLIAKVMHHIGSRLVALMHEVSGNNTTAAHSHSTAGWRRYPHHRTPSSASTTEDDDSTSDSAGAPTQLPRSKSHDPLLLINGHAGAASMPPEAEEREASDYERFSWRGSFESALMAADSRTKLSLLACSGDVSATAMAAKRRSAGDLLFNPKSFSREQLDRVRSCGSIGGAVGAGGNAATCGGSIEEKIWSNRRRSSVPDANTRGESGASAGDEDTEDEDAEDLEYGGQSSDPRATTLPRGVQGATGAAAAAATSATNSLPRQTGSSAGMHKAHSVYHFLPQHSAVKSARYRPPGFARNSPGGLMAAAHQSAAAAGAGPGPKRAFSAPGLQLPSRSRRQPSAATSSANVSSGSNASADEASSLSEACSTPIIGTSSRGSSSHASMDLDEIDRSLHAAHIGRASLSSLGARSDSMASVYSGAGEGRWCGSVAVRGEVEFSLQYDYKQLTLEVHVTQCRDLAPVDVKRNRSDPYVKVYLLPDKSKSGKRKTKVKKHTLNPVFDETLKFHTSLNNLESRTLWLTVWHSDMFGRNDFLGEVRMPLENKIFDDPRPQWYPLQERTEPFDDPVACKGEVIVGLKFVPPDPARQDRERETSEQRLNRIKKSWSKGALHVLVKEARNLQTRAKNSGTCDPFCKSYLLPDKGRSGKQKTGVVRRSSGSPIWNHTFVYKDVSLQELADRGLELTVWDHDRIGSNEFLGGIRFNLGTGKHYGKAVDWMDATGREMSLWQSMLERPNFWVEGVVTLRPNLHNHGKTGTS